MKKANLQRYHNSVHADFEKEYPIGTKTVARRVESMSLDKIEKQLHDMKNPTGFSLALDESCNITDTVHLLFGLDLTRNIDLKKNYWHNFH